MIADIVAVLVVPAVGDPGRLTAQGVCGHRSPIVWRAPTEPHCAACGSPARWSPAPTDQTDSCWVCSIDWRHDGIVFRSWSSWSCTLSPLVPQVESALPLWWDGALVPEGWDRLRRALPGMEDSPSDPTQHGGPAYIERMIEVYDGDGPARVGRVVRLARVDGRLVEVES